jgi:hypothetical protein
MISYDGPQGATGAECARRTVELIGSNIYAQSAHPRVPLASVNGNPPLSAFVDKQHIADALLHAASPILDHSVLTRLAQPARACRITRWPPSALRARDRSSMRRSAAWCGCP